MRDSVSLTRIRSGMSEGGHREGRKGRRTAKDEGRDRRNRSISVLALRYGGLMSVANVEIFVSARIKPLTLHERGPPSCRQGNGERDIHDDDHTGI